MIQKISDLDEEILNNYTEMIADYIIETKSSTRKAAAYACRQIFESNKPQSIENKIVQKRIYESYELLLENYNVSQIAKILNSTDDIIYRDLTSRLPRLDHVKAQIVKAKLEQIRLNNLIKKQKNNSQSQDISDLSYNTIKEFINMALTYRVSYKSLAKLFSSTEEEIRNTFLQFPGYKFALEQLDIETRYEIEINERVAYLQALSYLQNRSKILKKINIAKKDQNQLEINNLKIQFKQLNSLIDDSIVYRTIGKPLIKLTKLERESISKYHLKYYTDIGTCSEKLRRNKKTIEMLDQELAEKKTIFGEKIERLYDYYVVVEKFRRYRKKNI